MFPHKDKQRKMISRSSKVAKYLKNKGLGGWKARNCVEDAEALLNIILLLDAFLLSFVIELVIAVLSHDDILAADQRNAGYKYDYDMGLNDLKEEHLGEYVLSVDIVNFGLVSSFFLFVSIILTSCLYVSLNTTDAREDQNCFDAWYRYGFFIIVGCFALFVAALICFFTLLTKVIQAVYPRYCDIEDFDDFWDPATRQMITITKGGQCRNLDAYGHQGIISVNTQIQNTIGNVVLVVCCVGTLVGTIYFNMSYHSKVANEILEDDDGDDIQDDREDQVEEISKKLEDSISKKIEESVSKKMESMKEEI